MNVGKLLREARIAAGITQSELARTIGISIFTMNRVEAGSRNFDEDWLPKLPPGIRKVIGTVIEADYRGKLDRVHKLGRNRFLRKDA